jgi:hypothetical protein
LSYTFGKYRDILEAYQFRCSPHDILTKITASAMEDLSLRHKLFSALRLTGNLVNDQLAEGLKYLEFRKYMHQRVDRFIEFICNTMHRVTLEQWNDRRSAGHGTVRVPLEVMSSRT